MRIRLVTAALTVAALVTPALARADHRELIQLSRGASAGNSPDYATYGGMSADGTKVWFSTPDALVPEDTDGVSDVYEASANKLTLVSVPEGGPYGGDSAAGFAKASADGSTVVFSTAEEMTAGDDDGSGDWYARRDGHTYLVSKPDPGAFLFLNATPLSGQVTPDGTHVFFATLEDLGPGDSNFQTDLYEWRLEDQLARPVSVGTDDQTFSSGAGINVVAVASADGSRAFFETRGALVPEDSDTSPDIYMRENGQTTLVTKTTSATPADATMRQLSADGQHVLFQTYEALVPEDTDSNRDVYEVQPGGESQLVSIGTQAGPTPEDADFQRVSSDGTRVFFTTLERLLPDDTDDNQDIYMRSGGQTTLETVGPTGGNTGFDDIVFSGLGPDSSRMYFTTHEALTADDLDFSVDIYERHDGQTRRVSVAPEPYDSSFGDANFAAASPDGSRIVFQSQDPMHDGDTDQNDDLYEFATGDVMGVLTGGTQNVDAIWGGASSDARTVVFTSTEQLTPFDTDDQADVFESRINRSPSISAGAATTHVSGSADEPGDPAVAVDDPDTPVFSGATVTLAGALDDTEALGFADRDGIQGALSPDKRTVTLSGDATLAAYQAALRAVTYGGGVTAGERGVTFTITDGIDTSAVAAHAIEVVSGPPSDPGTTPPDPGPPPPSGESSAQPRLTTTAPADAVARGDRIDVRCTVDGAAVESCSADAFTTATSARLVRIGHGSKRGSGVIHVRLTHLGMKRLRERGRASRVLLRVTARVKGRAQGLQSRRSLRVLVRGTVLRGPLYQAARDLRGAQVVRCEARTRARARKGCSYLRRHGVKAKLVVRRSSHVARGRVLLRVLR